MIETISTSDPMRVARGVMRAMKLLGHVGSPFAAGHETSGNALTWTLLLLSQHPQVASDLVDELEGELRGEPPTVEQLGRLPLLENVLKESMRIIPPAPVTWRRAAHSIEVGGYEIPEGTEVYASIYETHHMPELYPEPERFDPGRWETTDPGTYEYIPFNAGPRRCIGASFAMMEIKVVLAVLLRRYRLESLPQKVDRFGFPVISPKGGLQMVVHRQDRRFGRGVGGIRGNVREMVKLPA